LDTYGIYLLSYLCIFCRNKSSWQYFV